MWMTLELAPSYPNYHNTPTGVDCEKVDAFMRFFNDGERDLHLALSQTFFEIMLFQIYEPYYVQIQDVSKLCGKTLKDDSAHQDKL
ncbi:hypothetical protein TNCV_119461 [Trichonephila clavipes]|nr:hypothetical protein TNCV_119461 [Trichonephila clavipes]